MTSSAHQWVAFLPAHPFFLPGSGPCFAYRGVDSSAMFTFILGGARSGKSRFAQSLCHDARPVVYLATARVEDDEMRARIARHIADRPPEWHTVEEPLHLATAVRDAASQAQIILIDCLTVWLSNLMWELREQPAESLEVAVRRELDAIHAAAGNTHIIAVSNEVGCGVVPESSVGRTFRDLQGIANQHAAALADRVWLTVAGIGIPIKPLHPESRSIPFHHE